MHACSNFVFGSTVIHNHRIKVCVSEYRSLALSPQVRKLSVKRIITPIIFDNLKNAVPGGLYDPSLGPLEPFTE